MVLDTLTFYTTAPLGTAVITATGATSGKTATAQVTVVSSSTSTGGTASITTNKSSYVKGQTVSVTGTGYLAGEKVKLWLSKDGITRCTAGDMTATSSGTVSGSINACYVASSGLNVRAQGRTSGRMGVKGITVTDSTSGGTTTARITAPTSVHDGDTFTVNGTGFKGGEKVTTTVSGTWRSSSSSWNGKTFSASTTVTASSSGSFSVRVKTPEVPSGVSTTATIRSKGLTSGKTASRTISVI